MFVLHSLLFGFLSMFAYAFANAFSKPLSQKLGAPQTLFLRGFAIVIILGIASIPTYHYWSHWEVALAALVLGIVGYLPVLAFTYGIKESPLGIVAPIAGASPLITVILSFLFLGALLKPGQWVAVVLIIATNVFVSVDIKNWRQSNFLKSSSGIPFALAAAMGWGLFFFLLVPVTRTLNPWLAALLVEVGITIAAGMHIKFSSQKVSLKRSLQPSVIANGIFVCLGTIGFTVGVKYFSVGIVESLSISTALITSIIGVYVFHERLRIKDRVAAFVMIASVAALTIF